MPASSESVLTSGHILSNMSTMVDGVALSFTTPSIGIGALGFKMGGRPLVLDVFIPAFTTRNPATPGVGAYSRPYMTVVVQVARGNPATEANWRDFVILPQIRPLVPSGSTGAGTAANPVLSNRYRVAFQVGSESNIRLSGQYLGSFPDFSQFYVAIVPGILKSAELD